MGTRSLTLFFEKDAETPFATMYRQFDGYPDGHGKELAEFLLPRKRINGISNETAENAANGMGCLAAQVVTHFKTMQSPNKAPVIGGFYLVEYNSDGWQEYEYEVRPDTADVDLHRAGGWELSVYSASGGKRKKIFKGSPEQFLADLKAGKIEPEE